MYVVGGMCVQIICKCASTAASSRWWWQHWSSDEAGLLGWSTETEKKCAQFQRGPTRAILYCSSSLFKVKKMVSAPKSTERPNANCKEWLSQLPGIIVLYWSPACLACLFCLCWLLHHLVSVESQFFLFSNPLKNLPSSPFFIHHMQNSCVDIQTHAARVTYYLHNEVRASLTSFYVLTPLKLR